MAAARAFLAPCLLALVASACSRRVEVRDLAAEFDPATIERPGRVSVFEDGALHFDAQGPWLAVRLGDASTPLAPAPWGGAEVAHVPALSLLWLRSPSERRARLESDDGATWRFVDWWAIDPTRERPLEAGTFTAVGEQLFVASASGRASSLTLYVPVRRGQRVGERCRVVLGPLTGDGFDLWPGESWSCELATGPARRLDFVFASLAYVGDGEEGAGKSTVRWRVELDGRELASGACSAGWRHPGLAPVSVPLGTAAGTLRFTVEGLRARSAFLAPRIVPADAASDARPDAALFLADTFRADLLGHATAAGPLTPHLDAFAASGVRFERARSPASWTLPAHASLFSTLQPAEHGVLKFGDRLPRGGAVLAEHLRGAGYRTLAITNGGFVGRPHGMDHGFEVFLEYRGENDVEGLIDTLAPLLQHPDERPLFLFFHTFRTHDPYVAEAATRARLGAALGVEREWPELLAALEENGFDFLGDVPVPEGHEREVRELEALYRAGAADLDRGFARWLDVLAAAGRDDVVVFTSDHGEAFGVRDGLLGHRRGPWEDQLRVPLVVRARGLAPGVERGPATLMDVPRTLCALLGLPPARGWQGSALLGPGARSRAPDAALGILAGPDEVAWIEGDRKVVALGQRLERRAAFDLAAEPYEARSAPALAPWGDARIEALLDDDRWRRPRLVPEHAELTFEHAAQLDALGYTGVDDG